MIMERKIGEIFEYNGEWYQCVEGAGCYQCAFNRDENTCTADNPHCTCRSDKKDVVFKKLEKVGEPYEHYEKLYQCYKLPMETEIRLLPDNCYPIGKDNLVEIEIKQNKEDMEEKNNAKHSNSEKIGKNLRPFDLQKAREGKPVCTRDGRKARIICFDYKGDANAYPILALISTSNLSGVPSEIIAKYTEDGRYAKYNNVENDEDLMMLPEKKEGWINVYKERCYETKEEAIRHIAPGTHYIDTIRVEWEDKE